MKTKVKGYSVGKGTVWRIVNPTFMGGGRSWKPGCYLNVYDILHTPVCPSYLCRLLIPDPGHLTQWVPVEVTIDRMEKAVDNGDIVKENASVLNPANEDYSADTLTWMRRQLRLPEAEQRRVGKLVLEAIYYEKKGKLQ